MYPNKAQQQVVDMFMDIKKRLDQVYLLELFEVILIFLV